MLGKYLIPIVLLLASCATRVESESRQVDLTTTFSGEGISGVLRSSGNQQYVSFNSAEHGECEFSFPIRHREFRTDYENIMGSRHYIGMYNPKIETFCSGREVDMTFRNDLVDTKSEEAASATLIYTKNRQVIWGVSDDGQFLIVSISSTPTFMNIGVSLYRIHIKGQPVTREFIEILRKRHAQDLLVTKQ